jgi:hypothetical protein
LRVHKVITNYIMSLLLNASPWTSTTETPKKRIPSIKRTITNLEKEYGNVEGGGGEVGKQTSAVAVAHSHLPSSSSSHAGKLVSSVENDRRDTSTKDYSAYGGGGGMETGVSGGGDSASSLYNDTITPLSFKQHLTNQDTKNAQINQILENMANLRVDNEGGSLYNYTETPIPNLDQSSDSPPRVPIFQRSNMGMRQPVGTIGGGGYTTEGDGTINQGSRGVNVGEGNIQSNGSIFSQNTPDNLANFVTYSKAYEVPKEVRPYYAQKLGLSSGNESFEEKIMDKIQYLTHLMEEIQSEKTANINEEFILYTMLGVFVIYIVDAFSKSGKYIR